MLEDSKFRHPHIFLELGFQTLGRFLEKIPWTLLDLSKRMAALTASQHGATM